MNDYFKNILANREGLDPDEELMLRALIDEVEEAVKVHMTNHGYSIGGHTAAAPAKTAQTNRVGDIRVEPDGQIFMYDGNGWFAVSQPTHTPGQPLYGVPKRLTKTTFKDIEIALDFPKKKEEGCPKCGHLGNFVRMALCCPIHGMFGGC